ncbi:MAG: isopentenyl-diphosphate Delta-isomerase [Flavobacteriales bacterium]|nr:isopentenyl-diphosphate Delta-isomerase [Flavobacteriales bacterium]
MEEVVLVDEQDNAIGSMEKLEAHEKGVLHRAFSIFIFNNDNELLIHQRAAEKYHSANLWTNTCCSHPRPEEALEDAVVRRLDEEMGMMCNVEHAFSFIYRSEFDNDLIEHELDHVFIGYTDDVPTPDPEEVQAFEYISLPELVQNIAEDPEKYTTWFRICLPRVIDYLEP